MLVSAWAWSLGLVGRWVLESYVREGPFDIFEYQRRTWKIPAARNSRKRHKHLSFSFLAIFSLARATKATCHSSQH